MLYKNKFRKSEYQISKELKKTATEAFKLSREADGGDGKVT
jgi:hypothetical protein